MQAIDLYDRYHLTVENFHKMAEIGIIPPDLRVELIEGDIINMAPIESCHAGTLDYLVSEIGPNLSKTAILRVQNPVILGTHSQLQADLAVLQPRDDYYRNAHPTANDVMLLIEISDTSLNFDRDIKIPLYAKNNIPEAWIVNLEEKRLELYRTPNSEKGLYQDIKLQIDGDVSPLAAIFKLDITHVFN